MKRIKKIKKLKKYILKNKDKFKSGKYFPDKTLSYYVHNNFKEEYNKLFDDKFTIKKSIFQYIKETIKKLLYTIYVINNKEIFVNSDEGEITCAFITYDEDKYKLFNLSKEYIITKYSNEYDFKNQIKTYDEMSQFFKIPNLIILNKLETKEKLIQYKRFDILKNEELDVIMEDYLKSLERYLLAKKDVDYEIIDINKKKECIPIIKLYGDLAHKNILYSTCGTIYYIDFTPNYKGYFLNDFFNLIYTQKIIHKNQYYYEKYFNGEYNEYIKKVSKIINYEFDEKKLEKYIKIYMELKKI